MKKKNLAAALLALCLLVGMFAGCGNTSSTASSAAAASAPQAEESTPEKSNDLFVPSAAPAAASNQKESAAEPAGPSYTLPISEEGLTYTYWMCYAPFAPEVIDVDGMKGLLVLDTLQEVTNIHFDITAANGAAEQDNFNLMIAAGDYCDIINGMNNFTAGLEAAVEQDIIQDLADIIPEKCPNYWAYLNKNTNSLMQAYTDSGYMPTICTLTPEVGQEVVGPVIRKDWLNEFGMEVPKTFDELYDYLQKAKSEKNALFELNSTDGLVLDLAYGLNLYFGEMLYSDSPFTVQNGKAVYSLTNDNMKTYLKFMNRLYTDGLIPADFFSETSEDVSAAARLDFGLSTNSLVSVSAANSSDIMMNVTDENFEMAVLPYVTDGTTEPHTGPASMSDTMKDNDAWAFSIGCTNIDPLLEMVEFLYSDEGYLLSNYGVEGESYTMVDGKPTYTELITNNPDGLSSFFASYKYATNAASSFFPYINDMSKSFYDFNDNQWEVYEGLKNLSDCAYNYPAYAKMTAEETEEYTRISAEISTYTDTRILEFITGAADIDADWDNYVSTIEGMGLQDMVDVKQDAYDRAMQREAAMGL